MLEAKTLTIKKSTNKSGKVVNFIPEMVEDKEVYSVVNKNNEHCGYITEALFNLLMEQDPEEKENKALFHRALGVDDEEKEEETLIFGKKIILDVSSTKDINDFEKIILSPVTYTKGAKPLTIKIGTFFCIQNQGKLLDINVKSDFIECDNFLVSNLTSTKLNIDLNNKSPYFGGIHLYGIENFQNPGGEINLHIKANSKNGYSSINIHQLTIDSEKIGDKNPLHIGFEFGDGVLNASGARINIQSSEKSTKKNIDLNGVDFFLDGGNTVNGNLKFDGDAKHHGNLRIKELKSHSTLIFRTRNCGFFKLFDSTLNNGKKNIVFQRGETYLTNVNIENEGKSDLILGNVSIRNSKLTNISDLHDSEIANTEVLNFTLKTKNPVANKTIFSFGPMMDHAQKGYDENKSGEAFCSLKNTVVKLNESDFFHNNTSGPLHLINSVVEGTTTIKTSREEGSYSLTIDSSVLNNAQIFLTREDNIGQDVATTISTSEISTFLRANGLKAVQNSVIVNGDFDKVDEINDSVCEFVSLDGKDNKILNGYNSVDEKESINMGQAINDLEIL